MAVTPIERVNQELKRRSRVASIFPNEASLLRLMSALLCEQNDEWLTGKVYLNMTPDTPDQAFTTATSCPKNRSN